MTTPDLTAATRPELLARAEDCGAKLTGRPDGSEAITIVFTIQAWRAFDAFLAAQQAWPPEGWALMPLRLTQAMRDVVDQEDWTWGDLLAAAGAVTEDEYAIANAPEPPVERAAEPASDELELAREADTRAAAGELRDAMGNPVIAGGEHNTLHGQTMRMAASMIRAAAQVAPKDHTCPECDGVVQWRCAACGIRNYDDSAAAQAAPVAGEQPVAMVIPTNSTPSVRLEWYSVEAAHNAQQGLLYYRPVLAVAGEPAPPEYIITVIDNEHPNGIPYEEWVRRPAAPPAPAPVPPMLTKERLDAIAILSEHEPNPILFACLMVEVAVRRQFGA